MPGDPELDAMGAVIEALEPLDDEARTRVLSWVTQRLDVRTAAPREGAVPPPLPNDQDWQGPTKEPGDIDEFSALYDVAAPSDDTDSALVGAYWVAVVEEKEPFGTQAVNNELKNLGRGITAINKVFDRLKNATPSLVRQVSRGGTTQQARKEYKITAAGKRRIEELITPNSG